MAYQIVNTMDQKGTNDGPRTAYLDDGTTCLVVGAWSGNNYIQNNNRPLILSVPRGMQLSGLTTAPAGTHTSDLCVDDNGNIYRQS